MRQALFLLFTSTLVAQTTYQSATWSSSTANNTVLSVPTTNYSTVSVFLAQTGTLIQGGTVAFEGSDTPDATVTNNWFNVPCAAPTTNTPSYLFTGGINQALQCNVAGTRQFRARLSNPIGGTGTVFISMNAAIATPPVIAITGALAAASKTWLSSAPGAGSQATVTFAAPGAGKTWVLDCLQGTMWIASGQTTAAATVTLTVSDGAAVTYFQKQVSWNAYVNTATTGAANQGLIYDQPLVCGLGIAVTTNQTLTVAWSASGTQLRQSVSAGAFLIQ